MTATSEPYWYRRIDAVARFPEPRESQTFRTIKLSHEEPLDVSYSEHISRVADMLERAGIDDDQPEGATITFRVTWRGEPR